MPVSSGVNEFCKGGDEVFGRTKLIIFLRGLNLLYLLEIDLSPCMDRARMRLKFLITSRELYIYIPDG